MKESKIDTVSLRDDLTAVCGLAALALAPALQENMWITDYDDGRRLRQLTKNFWEVLKIDGHGYEEKFGELTRFAEWVLAVDEMRHPASEHYNFDEDFKPLRGRYAMMLADLVMVAFTEGEDWYALDKLAAWDLGFISAAAGSLCMADIYESAQQRRQNESLK